MYRTLLAGIALLVSALSAAGAGPLRKWSVADWEINEYPGHCSGSSVALRSGTTILFFAVDDRGIHAVVANSVWRMTPNRTSKADVSIDGDAHGSFPTTTYSATGLAVTLPASLLRPLQEGDAVTFQFPRATYSFTLKNTRTGLAALVKCYVDKARETEPVAMPSTKPSSTSRASSGTGLFVGREGYVLTNAHVVERCSSLRVTDKSGNAVPATVVAHDDRNDLALLRTGLKPTEIAAFRMGSLRLGESVAAFGFPLSSVLASSGNFTLGSVSATAGLRNDTRFVQISAPVQPGNSGGPLLDQYGNITGIVSSKLNALAVMVATGGDIPQNVNFAIKVLIIRTFLESNQIEFVEGSNGRTIEATELAERAQAMSVFIQCDGNRP